jgi:hypothetical protein
VTRENTSPPAQRQAVFRPVLLMGGSVDHLEMSVQGSKKLPTQQTLYPFRIGEILLDLLPSQELGFPWKPWQWRLSSLFSCHLFQLVKLHVVGHMQLKPFAYAIAIAARWFLLQIRKRDSSPHETHRLRSLCSSWLPQLYESRHRCLYSTQSKEYNLG